MELTKAETRLIVLAIGTAIEQETLAIRRLEREQPGGDIKAVIAQRSQNILDLGRLRDRLTSTS